MGYCDSGYFETIQQICLAYLSKNYDFCYLSAMHHKNRDYGADTIIVGSSHAMNGIIEKELTAAGEVVQFSISSQDLYYDFEHIKKAVSEGKRPIKRCMINLGYYTLHQDISLSTSIRELIQLTYLNLFGDETYHNWKEAKKVNPFSRVIFDEEIFPRDIIEELCNYWAEKAILEQNSYYGNLLTRENGNMLGLKKVKWATLNEDEREAYTFDRVNNGHNKHINHIATRAENGAILSEVVDFLVENHIKPYFFITPFTDCYMRHIDPRYKADIIKALDELDYPVEFLDMNDYSEQFDDSDFLDSDHLNLEGAHKATALLNSNICIAEGYGESVNS